MERFLLNGSLHAYTRLVVGDEKTPSIKGTVVVIICDTELNDRFSELYKMTDTLLKNGNRLVLVSVEDKNKVFMPLASLLMLYRNYDIYRVDIKSIVTADWLERVLERHPDYNEVQNYVSAEMMAYTDLSNLFITVEDKVKSGDVDGLRDFVEKNTPVLEMLTLTLNNMKKQCDISNSSELNDLIADFKQRIDGVSKELSYAKKQLAEKEEDSQRQQDSIRELRSKVAELEEKIEDEDDTAAGSGVIKQFKTINMGAVKVNAKHVIYFKELTYVPYVNSFIMQFMQILKVKLQSRVKLLIYDTNTEFYASYNPLRVVDGREYIANRDRLINQNEAFVVSEPNPQILTDALADNVEVLIVYDRMHTMNDLLTGNLLTKFFIVNSNTELMAYKTRLKIASNDVIISRKGAIKGAGALYIDTIDMYSGSTPSSKMAKYSSLKVAGYEAPLVKVISRKARIDMN